MVSTFLRYQMIIYVCEVVKISSCMNPDFLS